MKKCFAPLPCKVNLVIGLSFRRKAVIKGSTPPLGVGGSPGTLSEAAKIEDS